MVLGMVGGRFTGTDWVMVVVGTGCLATTLTLVCDGMLRGFVFRNSSTNVWTPGGGSRGTGGVISFSTAGISTNGSLGRLLANCCIAFIISSAGVCLVALKSDFFQMSMHTALEDSPRAFRFAMKSCSFNLSGALLSALMFILARYA